MVGQHKVLIDVWTWVDSIALIHDACSHYDWGYRWFVNTRKTRYRIFTGVLILFLQFTLSSWWWRFAFTLLWSDSANTFDGLRWTLFQTSLNFSKFYLKVLRGLFSQLISLCVFFRVFMTNLNHNLVEWTNLGLHPGFILSKLRYHLFQWLHLPERSTDHVLDLLINHLFSWSPHKARWKRSFFNSIKSVFKILKLFFDILNETVRDELLRESLLSFFGHDSYKQLHVIENIRLLLIEWLIELFS